MWGWVTKLALPGSHTWLVTHESQLFYLDIKFIPGLQIYHNKVIMRNVSVGGMRALERGDKMFSSLLTPDPAAYGMLAFSYKQTDAVKDLLHPSLQCLLLQSIWTNFWVACHIPPGSRYLFPLSSSTTLRLLTLPCLPRGWSCDTTVPISCPDSHGLFPLPE